MKIDNSSKVHSPFSLSYSWIFVFLPQSKNMEQVVCCQVWNLTCLILVIYVGGVYSNSEVNRCTVNTCTCSLICIWNFCFVARSTKTGWGFASLLQHTEQVTREQEKEDDCVLWSFDDCSSLSSLPQLLTVKSDEEVMFPAIRKEQVFKDFLPDPKEILGPVSEVPGHPVTVAFGGLYGIGFALDGCMLKVKGVTMLYRRFRVEQLSNDGNDSATLHTLQLLPTYTQGDKTYMALFWLTSHGQVLAGLKQNVGH